MKKSILFLCIFLLIVSFSFGHKGKNKFLKNSTLNEIINLPKHIFQLKKIKIQNVKIKKQVYGQHTRNYYLLCENPHSKPLKKAIFFIHGGGWVLGKPENHLKIAEYFTEQGFLVILPAYRLLQHGDGINILNDIQLAYEAACQQIKNEYPGIDGIIIGGASAGGNLASLLALTNENGLLKIKGLFTLSGVLDLNELKPNLILKKYAGSYSSENYKKLNPINQLLNSQKDFPILCIHGTADAIVPICSTINFADAAQNTCHKIQVFYFNSQHIPITSAWYYDPYYNYGQKEILLSWILSL